MLREVPNFSIKSRVVICRRPEPFVQTMKDRVNKGLVRMHR